MLCWVSNSQNIEWGSIAQWVAAVLTLLAIIVALFKEALIGLFYKPILNIKADLTPPNCQKTKYNHPLNATIFSVPASAFHHAMDDEILKLDCYYLRIWVENNGNRSAKQVQVFASKLLKQRADLTFGEEEWFLPMNLKWSHSPDSDPEIYAERISSKMGKHCDLGHIIDPKERGQIPGEDRSDIPSNQIILSLDLETKTNTLSHLVPPGVYRLQLKVAASNCEPVTKCLEITLKGEWHDDQDKMFSDFFGIKVMNKCQN